MIDFFVVAFSQSPKNSVVCWLPSLSLPFIGQKRGVSIDLFSRRKARMSTMRLEIKYSVCLTQKRRMLHLQPCRRARSLCTSCIGAAGETLAIRGISIDFHNDFSNSPP